MSEEKPHHQPFPEDENGATRPQPSSYTMVEPRFREIYFQFYKETYRPSSIDRKTKELVAIGASLAAKCQGCLEGHIKKALKFGAVPAMGEEVALLREVVQDKAEQGISEGISYLFDNIMGFIYV